MEIPTWGYIVGIFMIVVGGIGLIGNLQSLNVSKISDAQKSIFEQFPFEDTVSAKDTSDIFYKSDSTETFHNMARSMVKPFHMSDYKKKWALRLGYVGIIVSFIYLMGGIFLLIRKKFSLPLAFIALSLGFAYSVFRWIIFQQDPSPGMFSLIFQPFQLLGAFISLTLIIVIAASDKTPYKMRAVGIEG